MAGKEAARRSGNYARAKLSTRKGDDEILSGGWTRAQCRTITAVMSGWFIAMAILEVVF